MRIEDKHKSFNHYRTALFIIATSMAQCLVFTMSTRWAINKITKLIQINNTITVTVMNVIDAMLHFGLAYVLFWGLSG